MKTKSKKRFGAINSKALSRSVYAGATNPTLFQELKLLLVSGGGRCFSLVSARLLGT